MRPAHPKGFWVEQTNDQIVWDNFGVDGVVADGTSHAANSPSSVPGNESFDPAAIVAEAIAGATETILGLDLGGPPEDFEAGGDEIFALAGMPEHPAAKAADILADLGVGPHVDVDLPAVVIGIPPWSPDDIIG